MKASTVGNNLFVIPTDGPIPKAYRFNLQSLFDITLLGPVIMFPAY
jgi:hypothetical protein